MDSFQASPELQQALVPLGREIIVLEGELVVRQGARSKGVYLIVEGSAEIVMLSDAGNEISRRVAGPGALLGVPATLCGIPYLLSATAREQSRLVFVDANGFDEFLRSRADLCLAVVQMMSRELAEANQTRNLLRACSGSECVLSGTCSNRCQ